MAAIPTFTIVSKARRAAGAPACNCHDHRECRDCRAWRWWQRQVDDWLVPA